MRLWLCLAGDNLFPMHRSVFIVMFPSLCRSSRTRVIALMVEGKDSVILFLWSVQLKDLDIEAVNSYHLQQRLEETLSTSKCHTCPRKPASFALSARRHQVIEEMRGIQYKMSNESLSLFPDFKQVSLVLVSRSSVLKCVP